MSLIREVGDIYETPGEVCVEWKIRNFFTLSEDGYYRSPVFAFAQSCWCLSLYPAGRKDSSKEYISLFLSRKDSNLPLTIDFTIGIMGFNGLQNTRESGKINVVSDWGWHQFYSRSELKKQEGELMPLNTLTIFCKLRSYLKNSNTASLFSRLWNCCRDLKAILDTNDKKDFTFHLSGDFKQSAHKVILESRSDYFKKMFGNDWLENKTSEGNLSHIEEETFKNVLSYLYSGDVEKLDPGNVCDIYKVAHELQLEELNQLCTEYMKRSINMDTICGILHLAEKYEEEELKENALKFLAQNAEAVFATDQWDKFTEENSVFAYSLLQNVIVKKMKPA